MRLPVKVEFSGLTGKVLFLGLIEEDSVACYVELDGGCTELQYDLRKMEVVRELDEWDLKHAVEEYDGVDPLSSQDRDNIMEWFFNLLEAL